MTDPDVRHVSQPGRVLIFDTTLRDGEQALSRSLSAEQKLHIALALENLGVDVIEAGFPISSDGDFEAARMIAQRLKTATPCGLARAVAKDIDACGEALRVADHFRIHTFIATSAIHTKEKLRKSYDEIEAMAVAAVKHARRYTDDVEFSCEDAGRTDPDQLCRMVEAAIRAGATTVNIPDTVGYTVPTEFGGIISMLMNRVPNIDKAVLSVHCHNDLGMATANSLTAVEMGARQIECCVNGLGERAGNCSLEEVAAAIHLRGARLGDVHTGIKLNQIARTSALVAKMTNEPVPNHKAIVGGNAFAHSSGIHQDGVLKNRSTYEILTPEMLGFDGNVMHMTARSGRHMVKSTLTALGYPEGSYNLDQLYAKFLQLADRKGQVHDYDLEALLFSMSLEQADDAFALERFSVMTGSGEVDPTATVVVRCGSRTRTEASTGNGPVDAIYNAVTHLTNLKTKLLTYVIEANGEGMDALGRVNVSVLYDERKFYGSAVSADVLEASTLAFLNALNAVERHRRVAAAKAEKAEKADKPNDQKLQVDTP